MTEPQDPFAPPSGQPTPRGSGGSPTGLPVYGAPSAAPPYGDPVGPAPYGAPVAGRRNGFGVAALVLGILSILGSPFFGFFGVLFGVLAIIFGLLGRGRAKRGEADNGGAALAGVITGTIGLVLGAAVIAVLVALGNSDAFRQYRSCNDNAAGNAAAQKSCSQVLFRHYLG